MAYTLVAGTLMFTGSTNSGSGSGSGSSSSLSGGTVGGTLRAGAAATPGHLYELDRATCLRLFGNTGRYGRLGVLGDGSCFYHSLCAAQNLEGYLNATPAEQAAIAQRMRLALADTLSPAELERLTTGKHTSLSAVKAEIKSPEVWANETAIKHAALQLGFNVIFLDVGQDALYCGVHGAETLRVASPPRGRRAGTGSAAASAGASENGGAEPKQPTITVAWVNRGHFEPIVRIEETDASRGARIIGVFVPSASARDAATVRHLMATYVDQCGEGVRNAHVT